MEVIARCVARETDLRVTHFEDFGPTTPRRCAAGATTSSAQTERLEQLGYDERFRRLWRLYLCYCEAGFAERRIGVVQALLVEAALVGSAAAARRAA